MSNTSSLGPRLDTLRWRTIIFTTLPKNNDSGKNNQERHQGSKDDTKKTAEASRTNSFVWKDDDEKWQMETKTTPKYKYIYTGVSAVWHEILHSRWKKKKKKRSEEENSCHHPEIDSGEVPAAADTLALMSLPLRASVFTTSFLCWLVMLHHVGSYEN